MGRVFVYDGGNHRVLVYHGDGTFAREFGRVGQGPGEITLGGDRVSPAIGVSADVVFLFSRSRRMAVWEVDDGLLYEFDHRFWPLRYQEPEVWGFPEDRVALVQYLEVVSNRNYVENLELYRLGSNGPTLLTEYASTQTWASLTATLSQSGDMVFIAVVDDRDGATRIVAKDVDGGFLWGRDIVVPDDIDAAPLLRVLPDGQLLVGWRFRDPRLRREWLVDVFDRRGERLAAVKVSQPELELNWQASDGDHVFGVFSNPETEEWEAARYRISADLH